MPARKKSVTLEQIFEKLVEHDKRFEQIDARFGQVDARFLQTDGQFKRVVDKILDVESSLKVEIGRVDERVSGLLGILDKFTGDFEKLGQEYHAITAALKRIERAVGDPDRWPDSVRVEMDALKERMSSIEARLPLASS